MQAVLDAVVLLGALRVVPAVDRADEVARDAADAFELLRAQLIVERDGAVRAVRDGDGVDRLLRLFLYIVDIVHDLRFGDVGDSLDADVRSVHYHEAHPFYRTTCVVLS